MVKRRLFGRLERALGGIPDIPAILPAFPLPLIASQEPPCSWRGVAGRLSGGLQGYSRDNLENGIRAKGGAVASALGEAVGGDFVDVWQRTAEGMEAGRPLTTGCFHSDGRPHKRKRYFEQELPEGARQHQQTVRLGINQGKPEKESGAGVSLHVISLSLFVCVCMCRCVCGRGCVIASVRGVVCLCVCVMACTCLIFVS